MIERGLAHVGAGARPRLARRRVSTGSCPPARRRDSTRSSSLWEAYYRAELRDRVHPLADRAFALAARRTSALRATVGLCWGDPAAGQHHLARRDPGLRHRLRGGVDRAARARRRLVADVRPDHARGGRASARPAGDPTRDEQLRMYEAASGRAGARRAVVRDLRGGALLRHRGAGDEPGRRPRAHARGPHHLAGEPRQHRAEGLLAEL